MDDVKKQTNLKKASEHGIQAPLALLAELSHRCPLQCPYCSNPVPIEKPVFVVLYPNLANLSVSVTSNEVFKDLSE